MTTQRNTMAIRRHDLLADVERVVAEAAQTLGIDKNRAQHLGAAAADVLTEQWRGQQITFPLDGYYRLSCREQAIVARRNQGAHIYELAREFHMTERGVRKLLQRCADGRAAATAAAEAQMDLFRRPAP